MKRLLALEKKRRGAPNDSLVFVGMANVANQKWCEQEAVLNSRASEWEMFAGYLFCRIRNAQRLELITKLPRSNVDLLNVGSEITFEDIESLLKKQPKSTAVVDQTWDYSESAENQAIDAELDPKQRGQLYELLRAELYGTIAWHFSWGPYTINGQPDGITDDFVYEYKTTKTDYLFLFRKPVALVQADIYGYFFNRSKKRVQIDILESGERRTFVEDVNVKNAQDTLKAFANVDAGTPARPPKAWKCKSCEFRDSCPICQL